MLPAHGDNSGPAGPYRSHHPFTADAIERFWEKVVLPEDGDPDACWGWNAARKRGYGVTGANGRSYNAHIFSYLLHKGPIPQGFKIRHFKCHNPPCSNPRHLRRGTQAQNIADSRGRPHKPHFKSYASRAAALP